MSASAAATTAIGAAVAVVAVGVSVGARVSSAVSTRISSLILRSYNVSSCDINSDVLIALSISVVSAASMGC